MNKREISTELPPDQRATNGYSRRNFLGLTGGLFAAGALLNASCNDDDDINPFNGITLTNDDFGILNYAYALEQLEAKFYDMVTKTGSYYVNAVALEKARLADIRDHEIAHREFFKAALGSKAIPTLQDSDFNFTSVNFDDRDSVLKTARTFEDLGVSAYNGAGKLIKDPAYLVLAGKIVSVEARHAAYIRDLLANGTFASPFDATDLQFDNTNGLDIAKEPSVVLAAARTFIKVDIRNNLPTS